MGKRKSLFPWVTGVVLERKWNETTFLMRFMSHSEDERGNFLLCQKKGERRYDDGGERVRFSDRTYLQYFNKAQAVEWGQLLLICYSGDPRVYGLVDTSVT